MFWGGLRRRSQMPQVTLLATYGQAGSANTALPKNWRGDQVHAATPRVGKADDVPKPNDMRGSSGLRRTGRLKALETCRVMLENRWRRRGARRRGES